MFYVSSPLVFLLSYLLTSTDVVDLVALRLKNNLTSMMLGAAANALKLLSPTPPVLPDELIQEILLRLPVRTLVELRSVCNSWKTLISSPKFARDHIQRPIADPTTTLTHTRLVDSENCKIGFWSVQPLFENPSASAPTTRVVCFRTGEDREILGSCNGLLCLNSRNSVILWNPCIGLASEWLRIELDHFTFHGFGYDHVHDKYKLLVADVKLNKPVEVVTKVCTFGENSWTAIQGFPSYRPTDSTGKFVSGTLNWLAWVPGTTDRRVILSFDLAKETCGQLSLPRMNEDNRFYSALQVLRNCLGVCFQDEKSSRWEVWLMKEYGVEQSWTILVTISYVELQQNRRCLPLEKLLCISEDGVVLAICPMSNKLVLYNSNDGRFDYPIIETSSANLLNYPMSERPVPRRLHIYHESLVSPSHCGLQNCLYGLRVDLTESMMIA